MTCEHIQPNLKAYLDREANPGHRVALFCHLWRCPRCRAELKAIRIASGDLNYLEAPRPSEEARQVVLQAARLHRPSPARAAGRRLRTWGLAFGAGALLLALALYLTLRPSPAQAALERVVAATEAVSTQHAVMWLQPPGGPKERHISWFSSGRWRMETWRDGKLTELAVYDGKWLNGYTPATNTAYLRISEQPFGTSFKGFSVAAMLESIADAEVKLEGAAGTEGRHLNRFTITHAGERLIILADADTDLPLSFGLYARAGSGWEQAGGSEKIEYDLSVDPALFDLPIPEGAGVVDNQKLKEEWQQRFDQGLARQTVAGEEVVLRDLQVTAVGDVFAIWTETGALTSSSHREAHLADNLGTIYVRGGEFQAWDKPCAWFIPLEPPTACPSWRELTVLTREGEAVHFRTTDPTLSATADPTFPSFRPKRGEAAFVLPWGVYAEIDRAQARANYWKDRGDPRRALQHFEEAAALADAKVHRTYLDRSTWQQMGELYEQIDEKNSAREAYQRALDCYESSSNRDVPPEKEAAAKLRAAIRRLR